MYQAFLYAGIVLIFAAAVRGKITLDFVVIYLADFNHGIDFHRVNTLDFKRPVAGKTNIAESRGDMDIQTKPSDRRPAFKHGNEMFCRSMLERASQI
jgi:hypothetical protein